MEQEVVVAVYRDGTVSIGPGATVGQVLDAVELVRRAVLGVVLRSVEPAAPPAA